MHLQGPQRRVGSVRPEQLVRPEFRTELLFRFCSGLAFCRINKVPANNKTNDYLDIFFFTIPYSNDDFCHLLYIFNQQSLKSMSIQLRKILMNLKSTYFKGKVPPELRFGFLSELKMPVPVVHYVLDYWHSQLGDLQLAQWGKLQRQAHQYVDSVDTRLL